MFGSQVKPGAHQNCSKGEKKDFSLLTCSWFQKFLLHYTKTKKKHLLKLDFLYGISLDQFIEINFYKW